MMKNINLQSYLVHVLIPFSGGISIYLSGRSLTSLKVNSLLKLNYIAPHVNLPDWFVYNLPDGLWLYSFLMWLIINWKGITSIQPFIWYGVMILGAIGSEFMQKLSVIDGTYDRNDINAYFIAILLCTNNYYHFNLTTQ